MSPIEKIMSSYRTMLLLFTMYAVGLSAATLIEKAHGSTLAKVLIYYSPLFFLLQLLLITNFAAIIRRRQFLQKKRWSMLLVHFSWVVILSGAVISHLFGVEGTIHLREGEKKEKKCTSLEINYKPRFGLYKPKFELHKPRFELYKPNLGL